MTITLCLNERQQKPAGERSIIAIAHPYTRNDDHVLPEGDNESLNQNYQLTE